MQGRKWIGVAALLGFVAVAPGPSARTASRRGNAHAAGCGDRCTLPDVARAGDAGTWATVPDRLPLRVGAGAVLFPCSLYALALGAPAAFA